MTIAALVKDVIPIVGGSLIVFGIPIGLAWWLSDGFACFREAIDDDCVTDPTKYQTWINPRTGKIEVVPDGEFGPMWYPY
ncbi:MAG: hypothetical protein ACK5TK_03405 [Betaproteobacteria bacterium]